MSADPDTAALLADRAVRKAATAARRAVSPAQAKRIASLRAELEGCREAAQDAARRAALPDAELARLAREQSVLHERIIRRREEGLLRELTEACGAPVSRKDRAS